MRTFRYLPPSTEEWRAFWLQLAGTLAALAGVGLWARSRPEINLGILLGAALGSAYLLWQSARALHQKSARARAMRISIDDEALEVMGEQRSLHRFPWDKQTVSEVRDNGVLLIAPHDEWFFIPREIEDGVTLAREISHHIAKARGEWTPPTNFIPLSAG